MTLAFPLSSMTNILSSFSLSHLNVLKVGSQRPPPDLWLWRHPKMQRQKNWLVLTLSTVRLSRHGGRARWSDAWPFLMMWWVLGLSFSRLPDSPGDLHLQSLLLGYLTFFCSGWVRSGGPPSSSGLCLCILALLFAAETGLRNSASSWQPKVSQCM